MCMCSLYLRSLIDASRNVQGRVEVFANVSVGVDKRANTFGRQAHLSDLSAAAEGSSLLSTIAPGTPTPL